MMPAADLTRLATIIARIKSAQDEEAVADASDHDRIAVIARKISEALLEQFNEVEKPGFQRLYDALSGEGVPTATLSVCGQGTGEIRYTQLMRYFLDPNEPHGLGTRVLRAALLTFDVDVCGLDLQKAIVKAEEPLGKVLTKDGKETKKGSQLDLLIEIEGTYVLIEHKINSGEGEGLGDGGGQIARYDEAIRKNLSHITDKNSTRVFLTRTGKDARGDTDWLAVSHRDLLKNMVGILDDEDNPLSPVAKHNLCAFLWDLLMGPIGVDQQVLSELRNRIDGAIQDSARSISLKQWCDSNRISWKPLIYILEKCYG